MTSRDGASRDGGASWLVSICSSRRPPPVRRRGVSGESLVVDGEQVMLLHLMSRVRTQCFGVAGQIRWRVFQGMSHGAAPRAAEKAEFDNLLRIEVETIESANCRGRRHRVVCRAGDASQAEGIVRSPPAEELRCQETGCSTPRRVDMLLPFIRRRGVRAVRFGLKCEHKLLHIIERSSSAPGRFHIPHTIDSKTNKSTLLLREMYWLLGICANRQRCSRRSYQGRCAFASTRSRVHVRISRHRDTGRGR